MFSQVFVILSPTGGGGRGEVLHQMHHGIGHMVKGGEWDQVTTPPPLDTSTSPSLGPGHNTSPPLWTPAPILPPPPLGPGHNTSPPPPPGPGHNTSPPSGHQHLPPPAPPGTRSQHLPPESKASYLKTFS